MTSSPLGRSDPTWRGISPTPPPPSVFLRRRRLPRIFSEVHPLSSLPEEVGQFLTVVHVDGPVPGQRPRPVELPHRLSGGQRVGEGDESVLGHDGDLEDPAKAVEDGPEVGHLRLLWDVVNEDGEAVDAQGGGDVTAAATAARGG